MGTLKIVSSDPDKALVAQGRAAQGSIFPMKEGDILNVDKLRKAIKSYGDAYGQYGFIDFTAEPDFDIDDAAKKINLTLRFDEQKQYYVRRINFSGNTTTRDKVIRRELLIDEGQLFNKRYWDISILRLNQLNYFDKIEADKAVELQKNSKEGTVDINLKLKEKGKQSIGLQGGVSGLSGGFIGLTYQTNNFLGLGETLTFSAQYGEIQRTLQFGFTQPYLFDRPISSGFTIFSSKYNFNQAKQEAQLTGQQVSVNPQYVQNYDQDSTGFTTYASYPMKRFSFARVGISYGLTHTNITAFNAASSLLFEQLQFRAIAGPSALNGIITSSITPSISYNTIDNPINATKGKSFYYSCRLHRRATRRKCKNNRQRLRRQVFPSRLPSSQCYRLPLRRRLYHRIRWRRGASLQPVLHGRRKRSSRIRYSLDLSRGFYPCSDIAIDILSRPHLWRGLAVFRPSGAGLHRNFARRRLSNFGKHRIPYPHRGPRHDVSLWRHRYHWNF